MKKALLIMSAVATMATTAMANDNSAVIGLGGGFTTSPYIGVGSEGVGIPIINLNYGNFFIRTGEIKNAPFSIGYDIYTTPELTFSVYTNPLGGYDQDGTDMDPGYRNIDDREYQVEVGAKATATTGIEDVKAETYFSYGEEGGHLGMALLKTIPYSHKLSVTPKVSATYFTSDYVDYYFGVTSSEAKRAGNYNINNQYEGDGAFSIAFDLTARYIINQNVFLGAFIGIEKLSSNIEDSPIVDDKALIKGGASIGYIF